MPEALFPTELRFRREVMSHSCCNPYWMIIPSFEDMKPIKRWQATAFLLLLPLLAFWKIFFAHHDYSFFTSNDAAQHWYPWYQYIARWMHAGILPLWDIDLQSGRPLLGEMRPGVLYPLNLAFFLACSIRSGVALFSMDLFVVMEIVLASVFQYRLARYLDLSRFASLVSAVIYGYSGYVVENATWQIAIFHAIIWLPPLVHLFFRANESKAGFRSALALLSAGVVFGIMILAGHIQPPVHAALCLALMAVYLPLTDATAPRPRWRGLGWSAVRLGSCFLTGLVVAAPQLIVSWEYGKRSLRWLGWDSLPPVNGVSAIPYAWGGHFERGHLQDIFTAVNPGTWAGSDYFGVAPVLLAAVAFLLARDAQVRFFKIFLVGSVLLWLGELSVFHGFLYQILPLMDKVRQPSRAIFLIHFCIATLAGFGAQALVHSIRRRDKKAHYQLALVLVWVGWFVAALIIAGGILGVVFRAVSMTDVNLEWTLRFALLLLASATILYFRQCGRLRLRGFRALLLAITAFDLLSVFSNAILSRYGYNNKNDFFPTVHYARNAAMDFLADKARGGLFRVEVLGDALPPNSGMVHGYQETTGGMATGLEEYHTFLGIDMSAHSIVFRLLNRRYIVSRSVLSGFQEVVHGTPAVYEDREALQRATWVPGALILESLESVVTKLTSPNFDPRAVVLVASDQSAGIPADLRVSGPRAAPVPVQGQVNVVAYEPNRIGLVSDAPQKGIVLLSEIAYPGWRATIDGVSVPIVTADYLLRAVVVEKGKHTIEFLYRPRLFSVALAASATVFFLPAVLLAFPAARRARTKPALGRHPAK